MENRNPIQYTLNFKPSDDICDESTATGATITEIMSIEKAETIWGKLNIELWKKETEQILEEHIKFLEKGI